MPFIIKKLHSPQRQKGIAFLMSELGLSFNEAKRMVSKGRLSQNGSVMNHLAGYVEGECEIICFEPSSLGLDPMYVSNDFVIYDKPSGLSVHPHSRRSPHTLNDEIKHRFGDNANATHRIDQETSGLVLVSLNKKSEAVLKQLFADRLISKRYRVMVKGHLKEPLDIQEPLLRKEHPDMLVSMVVTVDPKGKPSHTRVLPLRYFPEHDMTLVEAIPLSGRTHQIRVHLFHVKHPIIGDPLYGQDEETRIRYINKELTREERFAKSGSTRLLLHAHSLEFEYGSDHYRIESKEDFVQRCFEAMRINV